MAENHSISICIITKDESSLLKQCLERLTPHAQHGGHEILVVDTGSKDDTIEMCKAYTESVYEFPWINDFSAARNFAAEHAANDWILCIDSDEFITSWNEQDLQNRISKHEKAIGGFSLLCACVNSAIPASFNLFWPGNRRPNLFNYKRSEQIWPKKPVCPNFSRPLGRLIYICQSILYTLLASNG